MHIKKVTDIRLISAAWKELYENNPSLSPFQSYEWNLLLQTKFRHPINWILRNFLGRAKIEYWIFTENEDQIIAPLILKTSKNELQLFGQQDITDYLSFIFHENISEVFLITCIQTLQKEYPGFNFSFDRINESNIKMVNACMKVFAKFNEKKCVKIEVVDQLISKVKSDSRRYWKQAIHRIETDNLVLSFSINQTIIEKREIDYLLDHYLKRKTNKNKYSLSKQLLLNCLQFSYNLTSNKNDMVSLFITDNTKTFIAKCLLNNQISAYMLCTLRGEILYVLRISIDDRFSIYRPGILLIVETVNYLSKTIPSIKFLDFSRGDDSYKLNYGGSIHYNYVFTPDSRA